MASQQRQGSLLSRQMTNLNPNMISSCRKWASSSTDSTACVSITS